MREGKRLTALVLSMGMILMLLTSCACFFLEAGHECEGDACNICAQLARMEALLQSMAYLCVVLLAILAGAAAVRAFRRSLEAYLYRARTPVFLKTRLNN